MNHELELLIMAQRKRLKKSRIQLLRYAKTILIKYPKQNEYILKTYKQIENEILLMRNAKMKF
jgi:hypothetical protein